MGEGCLGNESLSRPAGRSLSPKPAAGRGEEHLMFNRIYALENAVSRLLVGPQP